MRKLLLNGVGWLAVALATLGIFLPLLPTVPFLLLAAGCFTQSSPKAKAWLFNHKTLGPIVRQWVDQKTLARKIKLRIIACMAASMVLSMLIIQSRWSSILLTLIGLTVAMYIWRRPEPKPAPNGSK